MTGSALRNTGNILCARCLFANQIHGDLVPVQGGADGSGAFK